MYNFGPAAEGESVVFGAQRPGYDLGCKSHEVDESRVIEWIDFMKAQGIQRVCCLLDDEQLAFYPDSLIDIYRQAFGPENVCHAPIPDYHLCERDMLTGIILPFLSETEALRQKVVVHCSGGIGRTGHVLAAWLVFARGLSPEAALEAVSSSEPAYRDPREAVRGSKIKEAELLSLLGFCAGLRPVKRV